MTTLEDEMIDRAAEEFSQAAKVIRDEDHASYWVAYYLHGVFKDLDGDVFKAPRFFKRRPTYE